MHLNVGGRTLAGPMGRGVPRQEPAVHFDGRQPTGRVRPVDLEGTVAGSRGFSRRRGPCPTGTGAIAGQGSVHSPYRLLAGENISRLSGFMCVLGTHLRSAHADTNRS
jgi:hypothetical protein